MKLEAYGITDGGWEHPDNEDAIIMDDKRRLYGVVDGCTTRNGVKVNGKEASVRITKYLTSCFDGDIKKTIEQTNSIIYQERKDGEDVGVACLTAGHIDNDYMLKLGHVGDGSSYLIRDNKIKRLSGFDKKPSFIPVVGECEKVDIETYKEQLQAGDCLILTTDGMMASLKPEDILRRVLKGREPKIVVNSLVEEIKKKPRIYKEREYRDDIAIIDILVKS
jgi:serine/threonine protein phosphatase PrpC